LAEKEYGESLRANEEHIAFLKKEVEGLYDEIGIVLQDPDETKRILEGENLTLGEYLKKKGKKVYTEAELKSKEESLPRVRHERYFKAKELLSESLYVKHAGKLSFVRALFEFLLPIIIGVYAVIVLFWATR